MVVLEKDCAPRGGEMSEVACVGLFCGAGGLTHGLRLEGIRVVAGFDVDLACRYPYEANNPGAVFH